MVKRHHRLMLALFGASDLLVAALAWALAYYLRYLGGRIGLTQHALPAFGEFASAMVLSMVLMLLIFSYFQIYQPKRTKTILTEIVDVLRAILLTWGLTYVVVTLLSPAKISRLVMVSVLVAWSALAILNRLGTRGMLRWFRRHGWNQRTAVVIGTGRLAQKLYQTLQHHLWTGINPEYFVGDPQKKNELLGLDVLGPMEKIDEIISQRPVDIAFVAVSGQQHSRTAEILDKLSILNLDVRVVPDLLSFRFLKHDVSQLDDIPIITMTYSPQHGWNKVFKRSFDIIVSAAAIVIMAVPMVLMALLVKLTSRGGVFYSQVRTSLGGKPFKIIKFRTMKKDAEADTGPIWAEPNDSRVTKLGRILRRTSLDELPQLLNVLAGQMSLVGPRPERPELIEQFRHQVPRYMLRNQVKAGLAGWAQLHGLRGQSSLRKRVQYDLYYITNWSFGLDLRILLMTPFKALIHRHAY